MIPIIQQTVLAADFRRSRQHITEMKMAYIRRRRRMFRRIFVREFKVRWDGRKRRFLSYGRYKLWGEGALEIGKEIQSHFGYSEKTYVEDTLWHFRRLYMRMYPHEDVYK